MNTLQVGAFCTTLHKLQSTIILSLIIRSISRHGILLTLDNTVFWEYRAIDIVIYYWCSGTKLAHIFKDCQRAHSTKSLRTYNQQVSGFLISAVISIKLTLELIPESEFSGTVESRWVVSTPEVYILVLLLHIQYHMYKAGFEM